jgi:geranylgeranylglycerol-phosphate geranylgeranyltransferase
MQKPLAFITIARPVNALMTGIAVLLGSWLAAAGRAWFESFLLAVAGILATAFGNVVNDIVDIESDIINHADRPLPRGILTRREAQLYAVLLAFGSMMTAVSVSRLHAGATILPLALLIIYAVRFKAVPLIGNILVSLLVAYAILFGSLGAAEWYQVVVPALLAFLLNFSREIIKDIQDEIGDRSAGVHTTAVLSPETLRSILTTLAALYLLLEWFPFLLGHFGLVYLIACALAITPLQVAWLFLVWRPAAGLRAGLISRLIKIEMLLGLGALAADRLVTLAG